MKNKVLIITMITFFVVAVLALCLVLNKGHIGSYALVPLEEISEEESIVPQLSLTIEPEFLKSTNKKETAVPKIAVGDEEVALEAVELESSDESIVKVNKDNELVAVADGKAKIIVKYDGLEAFQDIRVITPIKSMTFTTTNSTVRVGKDLQMKLKTSPANAYVNGLQYTSSDEAIALVDNSGIVTGVSAGKVTITVYDPYTELEKKVNLTIRK